MYKLSPLYLHARKEGTLKVGYVRVSTAEQNTARQDLMMEQLGVDKVFVDKLSGKNTNRPQLKAMLEYVREGDTLIVESYSRLSRSLIDLLTIVEELNKKQVEFISLKEQIDTTTPTGRLFMHMSASFAQYEREIIVQRTREGVAIAKAEGKYKGKQFLPKPQNWDYVIKRWRAGEITAVQAMYELKVKKGTFYNMVKRYE